ncbi:MAG: helix-turn-helix transcriptional regulator [Bacilli bacterium]|nr:helix-turn-helix transcriptional regulator [Bacilli bacterium]
MNIGVKIKDLRLKNKLTQDDLAKNLNVSIQAVSKWENGGTPDIELLPKIAKYFKVSTDFLLGIDVDNEKNIENALYKYITSFSADQRIKQIYKLGFIMSVASREEYVKQASIDELIDEGAECSCVVSNDGIMITSLKNDNNLFICLPKNSHSNYLSLIKNEKKQRLLCKFLSDELFYKVLIFLYSKIHGNFNEQLLVNNFNISNNKAEEILKIMKDFNIVRLNQLSLNGEIIKVYTVESNPALVGVTALLDLIVDKPNCYCYYYDGKNDYFAK